MKVNFAHYRSDLPEGHLDYQSPEWIESLVEELHAECRIDSHRKTGLPAIKAIVRCFVSDPTEDGIMGVGYALCSAKDNFVTRVGRRIALGRAVKDLKKECDLFEEMEANA